MSKYSISYTNLNPNFYISDLKIKSKEVSQEDISIISIIKNILNRGVLSTPSFYLRERLGDSEHYDRPTYYSEKLKLNWERTIKGSVDKNPALDFYENYLLKLLHNDITLFNSFIPELPLKEVLMGTEDTILNDMFLDFYSPLLRCDIEIDGFQHKERKQKISDYERDKLLKNQGINVIRIDVKDIANDNEQIKELASQVDLKDFIDIKENKKIDNYNAIIRYQMAILNLLEQGILTLSDNKWKFNVIQNDSLDKDVLEYAIKDLLIFCDKLLILQDRKETSIDIEILLSNDKFKDSDGIKIDLDIYKKYDNEIVDDNVMYIRNDYFMYDFEASVQYQKEVPQYSKYKNYYQVSNGGNFYKLDSITPKKRETLRFFLKTIFNFDDFLPKQEEIVIECLRTGCVIGLLPTGAGKSLCYQLSSLLLPGTTLVVSPLKILMKDQYVNMANRHGITNICYINSSNKGATDIIKQNKAKICLISPERFFNEEFLEILRSERVNISLVTVDEVHCLSEWGHDFRTSYLCLSHYLRENLDRNCHLLGLTATASPRVCEDVEIEFANFKGYTKIIQSTTLTRENLDLYVKKFKFQGKMNNKNTKYAELLKECQTMPSDRKTIVFTRTKSTNPYVPNSCYNLAYSIKNDVEALADKVDFFAGLSDSPDDSVDNDVKLQSFKDGKTSLLFSTKAFGMGVDIPDIRKTIHYEIPASLESLYQEFGRAGRDGKNSRCEIWYFEEPDEALKLLFNGDFSIKNVESSKGLFKEIATNLHFLTSGNLDSKEELFFENYLYDYLLTNCQDSTFEFTALGFIKSFYQHVGYNYVTNEYDKKVPQVSPAYRDKVSVDFDYKNFIDKAMYRLYLMGKISMWGVRYSADLGNPIYVNISVLKPSLEEQKSNLTKYIRKYEPTYIYNGKLEASALLQELITWAFNHFVYQRLQSIKNIYEACEEYQDSKQFMNMIVKYLSREEENESLLTNPADYTLWFKMLKEKSPVELKSIIARYLESDDKLVSLNFISGMVRLMLNDYENADGERRIKMAFEEILRFSTKEIEEIIRGMFTIVSKDFYKDKLVKTILEVNENFAGYLYKEYQNEEIESSIIYNIASKIKDVGGKINDKFRKD